jgi:hypothetical protein
MLSTKNILDPNSLPHNLAAWAMNAKFNCRKGSRARPGVNVKFLEIVQKRFIQFCHKFKNLTERVEA